MLNNEDKNKFVDYMQLLAKRFNNGKDLSVLDLKSYWISLNDEFQNIKEFELVVIKILKTWKYGRMPEPSYFIEAKKERKEDLEIQALNEWKNVFEKIELIGGYHSVKFENYITNEAIKLIVSDWYQLASKTYDELEWIKKDFIKIYVNLYNNPKRIKDEPILGYCDKQNGFIDYEAVKTIKMLPNTKLPKIKKNATQTNIEHNTSEFNTKINEITQKVKI